MNDIPTTAASDDVAIPNSTTSNSLPYVVNALNQKRAGRAAMALATYPDADTEADYTLSDLLTDLQHFAAQNAIDYPAAAERARINFGQEDQGQE